MSGHETLTVDNGVPRAERGRLPFWTRPGKDGILLRPVPSVIAALVLLTLSFTSGCARTPKSAEKAPNTEALHSFTYRDATIRYTLSGEGEPVVFVHGFGVSSYTWRRVAIVLSKSNSVICLDLKGFGYSDKPGDSDYSAYDQAEIIAAFLRQRDLRNVTVVGNSFGGRVAIDVFARASETPGRIKKLVLIDSAGPNEVVPLYIRVAKTPPLTSIIAATMPAGTVVESMMRAAFHDTALIDPDAVAVYTRHLESPGGIRALLQTVPRVFSYDAREKVWEHLDKIDIPVLVIWGERDGVIPVVNARRFREAIPGSRLIVFPRCGHMPQEEKPDETANAILQFLREPG